MNGEGGCEACPDEQGGGGYQTALYTAVGVTLTVVTCVSLLFACFIAKMAKLDEVKVEGADDGLEVGSTLPKDKTKPKSTATVGACGVWLKNILKDKLKVKHVLFGLNCLPSTNTESRGYFRYLLPTPSSSAPSAPILPCLGRLS